MDLSLTDYIQILRLTENPFSLSPDVKYFFSSNQHLAIKESLLYAINRGEGFIVLVGEAGTGKTLLLKIVLSELSSNKIPILIYSPNLSIDGMLNLILQELRSKFPEYIEDIPYNYAQMVKLFQDVLIRLSNEEKEVLIVVDEAQDVPRETLEGLRLLTNIETGRKKLLQILLVGQLELDRLLSDPTLHQLYQRITLRLTLEGLNKEELRNYVMYRLSKAGRGDITITDSGLKKLYSITKGVPRLVNKIMDRALLAMAVEGKKFIDHKVLNIAHQMLPEKKRKSYNVYYLILSLISAILLIIIVMYFLH